MNNNMRIYFLISAAFAINAATAAVSNISLAQRWPWNGKVDITYTLKPDIQTATPVFTLAFTGRIGGGTEFPLASIEGDGVAGITLGEGVKRTVWDASADQPNITTTALQISIDAQDVTSMSRYLKLDLSTYKMTCSTNAPSTASGAQSKYGELWFRRVDNGTFMMGSATSEPGRIAAHEGLHQVAMTKSFYIGVFELTGGQYDRINANGSSTTVTPQVNISYESLRGTTYGATWPSKNDHRVDQTSFFGKLRAKTGNSLTFDLPTEAQWEMACRAKGDGTFWGSSTWNNGVVFTDTTYNGLNDVAWNTNNSLSMQEVGLKAPSAIGTYDMHGNIWEWCLDYFLANITSYTVDPEGPTTGSNRCTRGGYYRRNGRYCRTAFRGSESPSLSSEFGGCRLALVP